MSYIPKFFIKCYMNSKNSVAFRTRLTLAEANRRCENLQTMYKMYYDATEVIIKEIYIKSLDNSVYTDLRYVIYLIALKRNITYIINQEHGKDKI